MHQRMWKAVGLLIVYCYLGENRQQAAESESFKLAALACDFGRLNQGSGCSDKAIVDWRLIVPRCGLSAVTLTSPVCNVCFVCTSYPCMKIYENRNMKSLAVATLVIAAFLASLMLTTICTLSDLGAPSDIRIEDLEAGRLMPMLFGETLWNAYPSLPHSLDGYFDFYSLCFAGLELAVVIFLVRKRGVSLATAAPVSLVLGFVPYATGVVVLRTTVNSPSEAGMWLSLMVFGLLYATSISAVLSILFLVRNRALPGPLEVDVHAPSRVAFSPFLNPKPYSAPH